MFSSHSAPCAPASAHLHLVAQALLPVRFSPGAANEINQCVPAAVPALEANSSKMSTYTKRASKPRRMNTCKMKLCNPPGMNTYRQSGGGGSRLLLRSCLPRTRRPTTQPPTGLSHRPFQKRKAVTISPNLGVPRAYRPGFVLTSTLLSHRMIGEDRSRATGQIAERLP